MSKPLLRIVDEQGELHELESCPGCLEKQYAYDELAKKYQGVLSENGKLKADKNREAAEHELWPVAIQLFEYWKEITGHKKAQWAPRGNAERFWVMLPSLTHFGAKNCAAAIAGIAFDPNKRRLKNGRYEVYDGLETCFGSLEKTRRYILRRDPKWVLPAQFEEVD
jgi:hypothetical protein